MTGEEKEKKGEEKEKKRGHSTFSLPSGRVPALAKGRRGGPIK
jgi:hypothetical protein